MGPTGKMRKRGRHTPVGRKRSKREENAKKMWSAGEKEEQKEQEGEEVIVTKESGKGRVDDTSIGSQGCHFGNQNLKCFNKESMLLICEVR